MEPVEACRLAQPLPDRRGVIPALALALPEHCETPGFFVGLAEEVQEAGEETPPSPPLGGPLVAAAPGTALHLGVRPVSPLATPMKNFEHSDLK